MGGRAASLALLQFAPPSPGIWNLGWHHWNTSPDLSLISKLCYILQVLHIRAFQWFLCWPHTNISTGKKLETFSKGITNRISVLRYTKIIHWFELPFQPLIGWHNTAKVYRTSWPILNRKIQAHTSQPTVRSRLNNQTFFSSPSLFRIQTSHCQWLKWPPLRAWLQQYEEQEQLVSPNSAKSPFTLTLCVTCMPLQETWASL